jgi:hypothetical protein
MALLAPAARSVVASGAAILLLSGVAACSSKGASSTVKASEAAQVIGSAYSLSPDQISCLEKGFGAKPAATRPLASDGAATDSDLQALGTVENACIAPETLAAAVLAGFKQGLTSLTTAQEACLNHAMTGLSDGDRSTLLVGLAVNSALGEVQQAELGRVTNGLLETCQLAITAPTTAPAN